MAQGPALTLPDVPLRRDLCCVTGEHGYGIERYERFAHDNLEVIVREVQRVAEGQVCCVSAAVGHGFKAGRAGRAALARRVDGGNTWAMTVSRTDDDEPAYLAKVAAVVTRSRAARARMRSQHGTRRA